jgi:hypothetical protein
VFKGGPVTDGNVISMYKVCPHCMSDLKGDAVPDKYQHWYGEITHYNRAIMVEIPGVYDGGLFYQCPDCGGRWPRFSKGRLHEAAKKYVNEKGNF